MLKPNDLAMGMEKIADEIFKHCQHGEQSKNLANGALACGQFYGDNVKNRAQRGLHGTAAAISILLASQKENHVEVAKKLLIYAKEHKNDPKNVDEDLNTIKQAEILAALNNLAEQPDYFIDLKNKLLAKQDASNGSWCYFLDETNKPSRVATCSVVLALNNKIPSDSNQLLESKKYLWKSQRDLLEQSKTSDIYAIAIRSLILYVLATCKTNNADTTYSQKELKSDIKNLWNICRPLYRSKFVVAVVPREYDRKEKNQYLRLPWQIYLAHALLLTDPDCFYTKKFQQYLFTLNQAALSGGYGENTDKFHSTRTNAVLYSFLDTANKLTPHISLISQVVDQFLEAWAKTWIRLSVVFTLGFTGLILSNHWKEQLSDQSPIWVEVIGAMTISALSWLYSTGRR